MWIDAHIVRVTGEGIVRVPRRKGNKPGVLLTLPDWTAPIFARRKLAARPHGPLFASLEGGWFDPSNTGNRLREALDEIGFHWVTSHAWRKTVGTLLDEAGLNVSEIADQLGNTRAVTEHATTSSAGPTTRSPPQPSSRSSQPRKPAHN